MELFAIEIKYSNKCVFIRNELSFRDKKKYRVIRNAYLFMSNGLCAEKKRREMHKNAFGKM